jgi:predicted ATPase/DNA-binding CsgD family transcriptional regulator
MTRLPAARRPELPHSLTSLIGRAHEIMDIATLLRDASARLVTLTGPGGIGKTRLALSVAEQLRDSFSDDAWFISLAPIADHRLVIPTIVHALGVGEQADQPILERLIDYLRERHALLVLDNVEHVIPAASEIARLLTTCPELAVLATGREPLHLQGEHQYPVPPLAIPGKNGRQSGLSALGSDAVRLFVERAGQVSPSFGLTELNAPVINEICIRLDGLPLALELAAARINVLSPNDLLARLDQPLKVLTGGPHDAPARQQTMRATLQWSYGLLTPDEQQLLRNLSVFAGGWTLAAVEATAAHDDVLATLSSLVDKSLVRRVDLPGQLARYDMLEPVREFARERLLEEGDEAAWARQRHARYFLALVAGMRQRLDGPDGPALFVELESEYDNLRAALAWLRESGQVDSGLQLVGDLGMFWVQHGYIGEAQAYAEAFLNSSEAPRWTLARAKALWTAGWLWFTLGKYASALPLIDEARAIGEEHGDQYTLAQALFMRGICRLQLQRDDYEQTVSEWERALPLFRELGDDAMVVRVLVHLGDMACHHGDLERSRAILEEALALARRGDLKIVTALALGDLGKIAQLSGDDRWAADLYRERLALYHELGIPRGIAETIEKIAGLARRQRQPERATCLFGVASALRERSGSPWHDLTNIPNLDEEFRILRSELPAAAFQSAWTRGRGMTVDEAIELALQTITNIRDESTSQPPAGLSRREAEVLGLIAAGRSNRQIAAELFISARTVERHIENLYRKLDVHNRAEAIDVGRRHLG